MFGMKLLPEFVVWIPVVKTNEKGSVGECVDVANELGKEELLMVRIVLRVVRLHEVCGNEDAGAMGCMECGNSVEAELLEQVPFFCVR